MGASAAPPPADARASIDADADVDPAPLRCADYGDGKRGAGCDLPADVLAFLDGRAMCEHWRGEPYAEPSELAAADPDARKGLEQRRQQVIDNANEACRGTDAALAALKAAHAGDPRVLRLLGGLDAQVE